MNADERPNRISLFNKIKRRDDAFEKKKERSKKEECEREADGRKENGGKNNSVEKCNEEERTNARMAIVCDEREEIHKD